MEESEASKAEPRQPPKGSGAGFCRSVEQRFIPLAQTEAYAPHLRARAGAMCVRCERALCLHVDWNKSRGGVVWCGVWCVVVFGVWCGTQKKTPCVDSKRPRVYRHHARMCQNMRALCRYTRGRFESTHGVFLDGHTGRGERRVVNSACQKLPTEGHHVPQRFTKETLESLPI